MLVNVVDIKQKRASRDPAGTRLPGTKSKAYTHIFVPKGLFQWPRSFSHGSSTDSSAESELFCSMEKKQHDRLSKPMQKNGEKSRIDFRLNYL